MADHEEEVLKLLVSDPKESVMVDPLRRELWIDGEINDDVLRNVIRGMDKLVGWGHLPIEVIVNSVGGDVVPSMAISDYIRYTTNRGIKVGTKVIGIAYSGGAIIASSGALGMRSCFPSAHYLIHQLQAEGVNGKMEDLQSEMKHLKVLNRELTKRISEQTGQPIRKVDTDLKQETFLSAKEAIEYGLVDHIVGERK